MNIKDQLAMQARYNRADFFAPATSRETIADMRKVELVKLLEAHGADTDGRASELRERLIGIMFVDL